MEFLKKTKGVFAAFLTIVMMLALLIPFAGLNVFAETTTIDVVLVIDDTGSMKHTDPDHLAGLAVRKFADLISSESDEFDVRFGIATYSHEIMDDPLPIGQTADAIKEFSTNKIKQSGKYTDAASGVKWAVDQLVAGDADTKAVILIGDGENDLDGAPRTVEESDADLNAALADATNNDINIYTLAINPKNEQFKQYFINIADQTGGEEFLPQTAEDIDTCMRTICNTIKGGGGGGPIETVVPPDEPVTIVFDVPDGVFEMNVQVEHEKPVELYFTDPVGKVYDEQSGGVTFYQEDSYSNFKIQDPIEGEWELTMTSDVEQKVSCYFVKHTDLSVALTNNQNEITQKIDAKYFATVSSKGKEIVKDDGLVGLEANLVVTSVANGKSKVEKMQVENGKFVATYAIDGYGQYEVYAELVGGKGTIKSNVMTIDVLKNKDIIPLWIILLIIFGVLIIIAGVILLIIGMRNKEGGDYVRGNVSMKLVGRTANEDVAIFDNNRFNCETIFEKKNTLSDLVSAYVKWYRAINTSELSELSISQYFNSALSEVTDKITICGNKKKQIIIRIPAGYDIQVDGMEVLKPKKIAFSSPEKAIDLKFRNQGCTYTINLVFTKTSY